MIHLYMLDKYVVVLGIFLILLYFIYERDIIYTLESGIRTYLLLKEFII